MDCSLPGSSVHRIFQARILEWAAISFSVEDFNLKLIKKKKNLKLIELTFLNSVSSGVARYLSSLSVTEPKDVYNFSSFDS